MSIAVTGATGELGKLVIKHLMESLPPSEIIAIVRNSEKAAPLANLGVEVRYGDYDRPESLLSAFTGVSKLLFISSSSIDDTLRIVQHANVVKAARDSKVQHIAYTGYAFAEKSTFPLANVHLATEYAILASGIPYTFLRNAFYLEVFINTQLKQDVKHGVITTNTGSGTVNAAAREDYARAAAAVLTQKNHENKRYNLTHSESWSFDTLAKLVADISGKPVCHLKVSDAEYREMLLKLGFPTPVVNMQVGIFKAVSQGEVNKLSDDLRRLIGNVTPIGDIVKQVFQS